MDRIVKGFLPSELWTFLSRLCVGLVLPPCLPNSIEVYLSYIFRHVLAFCPPPPYITTNSHHSSTHLLNTNILLLSLFLSLKHTEIHTQKTTRYRTKNKQQQLLLLLGVSICTFWHSVLSLSLICVCHWQISPLFPFAKIPISCSCSLALSISLSLTHRYTHRILQNTGEHKHNNINNNSNILYYLEYPFPRFGILFSLWSSACITGDSHHSTRLLKYQSRALSLFLSLSQT